LAQWLLPAGFHVFSGAQQTWLSALTLMSQAATWFQLALFRSTNSKFLILKS